LLNHRTTGLKKMLRIVFLALIAALFFPRESNAAVVTYFTSYSGTADSVDVLIGGSVYSTGQITYELNTSSAFESNFMSFLDSGQVHQEINLLVNAPIFASFGLGPIFTKAIESGTFTRLGDDILGSLSGSFLIIDNGPFAGFTWTNTKTIRMRLRTPLIDCEFEYIDDGVGTVSGNGMSSNTNFSAAGVTACPEPSSMGIFAIGAFAFGAYSRRHSRSKR
jgi:hypothetical protein